ncbi:transposase [Bacillus sp. Xin]|nr:transposase [Bacillus sp. Xin]NSW38236.1 transposase [Bacillus sp. Xin1]
MSKRKRTSKIDKWIKEGRETGSGGDYQPWLKIQDVSSLGRSTRLKGIKTGRQHEFLSDLERNYFYLTEFSDFILDIREQFPLLPQEETIDY